MRKDNTFRIHIPAVVHTRPTAAYSHCAFTTKARLLPKLLRLAYPDALITWYGVAWDRPEGADAAVPVLTDEVWAAHFGVPTAFVGDHAHVEHPGYVAFNAALRERWAAIEPGDLVCFPFGHAHQGAAEVALARGGVCVETGIGYPTPFLPFRIYESRAWLHYCAGKTGCEGSDYHFVAPASFDQAEWPETEAVRTSDRREIVYVGRLIASKGMAHLAAIAAACPDLTFTVYGEGDPTPWLRPNLWYGGVLDRAGVRDTFLHARAAIFPTRYIEPFCQAHIEALLCGVPVLGSAFGVFPETEADVGARYVRTARTLPEWVDGLRSLLQMTPDMRGWLAQRAHQLYGLPAIAPMYRTILDTIRATATPSGWYGEHFLSQETT